MCGAEDLCVGGNINMADESRVGETRVGHYAVLISVITLGKTRTVRIIRPVHGHLQNTVLGVGVLLTARRCQVSAPLCAYRDPSA